MRAYEYEYNVIQILGGNPICFLAKNNNHHIHFQFWRLNFSLCIRYNVIIIDFISIIIYVYIVYSALILQFLIESRKPKLFLYTKIVTLTICFFFRISIYCALLLTFRWKETPNNLAIFNIKIRFFAWKAEQYIRV